MFHNVHGLGRQPTDRNQTQLRTQRLQHHDDLWLLNPTTSDDGHSNHPQTGKRHAHPQPDVSKQSNIQACVQARTLLQSSLQTAGIGRCGPGLVSTYRNRSFCQVLKIRYINSINYLMFTIQYTKLWGYGSCDGNVTAATNKARTSALTAWFYRGKKKNTY